MLSPSARGSLGMVSTTVPGDVQCHTLPVLWGEEESHHVHKTLLCARVMRHHGFGSSPKRPGMGSHGNCIHGQGRLQCGLTHYRTTASVLVFVCAAEVPQ